jgi:hypothetical protein
MGFFKNNSNNFKNSPIDKPNDQKDRSGQYVAPIVGTKFYGCTEYRHMKTNCHTYLSFKEKG